MGTKCLFERCKLSITVNLIPENTLFHWSLLHKVCINIKAKKKIEEIIKGSWAATLLHVTSYSLQDCNTVKTDYTINSNKQPVVKHKAGKPQIKFS